MNVKVESSPMPGRLKSPGPGGWNSSPRTSVIPIGVTVSPASSALVLRVRSLARGRRGPREAHDRQPDAEPGSHDDPDGDEEAGPEPPIREPTEQAVDAYPGDQVAEPLPRVGA